MNTQKHQPILTFSFLEFRFFMGASFFFTVALLMQEVFIGDEMYKITGDPLAIGFIGLAQAVPFIGLSLVGGHLADIMSKKKMLMVTPDEMRGRVGSVNGIFISASNELGAFESGVAASLLGAVPSVVMGGALLLRLLASPGGNRWIYWA